ncbi:hypothetical protein [Alloactinosynnema sp. L-07]|uniref:endonuclease/exonuclease/phosphatase family protein n=1 Tax=Alloactinosynnema sp. L-07 TaxID=1653480 RepID=UPI00065EF273|nr:endonuclease/exonuclease/phosphatase family protein [Alloactinosynnema sp. L-07]CRK56525.1 hypothetical protein [Alloactinosynnema sp. L-07]
MTESMRVLSYNTQLRSALMEMGFPPSIPPVYTAPTRAKIIARNIVDSPTEIDVVCLNEVFDEPSRRILSDELRAEFPFQVKKADTFHTTVVAPGLSSSVMEKVWALTFGPLEDLASLAMLKLEDSGLFLASRFPFATVPTPPAVVALLGPGAFPNGVPVVRFFMYSDSSGSDKFAAKGILYVRLKPPGAGIRHVFLSHTQADTDAVEENAEDRGKQIRVAAKFIEHCVGESPLANEEVFFVGDLNIVGRGAKDGVASEWTSLFDKPGGPMSDHLVDRWGRDQCPGGDTGRTDPGFTADVVYPPVRQRLDYLITSANSQLAVQHLRVDKKLADPQGMLRYLSDHQPLLADIHRSTPHCTPATALVTPADVDFQDSASLLQGTVRWYRFDTPGTYDIALRHRGLDTAFEVYLGDDFSNPQVSYRNITTDHGTRFVLVAPFFIKVFLKDRHGESFFDLHTHRHDGRSLHDAIVLIPGKAHREHFPAQPFNIDTSNADWDDSESKWFLVETPRVPVPEPITLSVTVRDQAEGPDRTPVNFSIGKWDGANPPVSLMEQVGPDKDPLTLKWKAGDNEHFVVLVQRLSPPNSVVSFEIEANTTLSLLLATEAVDMSLTCQEETSGWGADDIAMEIRADGVLIADIPNSVIGDFEDDAVGHVGDKVPTKITPYLRGVEVTVIEEDDIDSNDIGRGTVPLVANAAGAPGFTVLKTGLDGTLEGSLSIDVDDGRYAFYCKIAPWHPGA